METTIRDDTAQRHKNKYENQNPIHKLVLGRFHDAMAAAINDYSPANILDFGCGEGFLVDKMSERGCELPGYVGVDLREEAINEARTRNPTHDFECADIFQWPDDGRQFDLVIASEVLEHLIDPARFLDRLAALSTANLLLTVPHEPWFQISNLVRGRDLIRLGNHPEHINHWNTKTFAEFAAPFVNVEKAWTVFPFVFVSASVRK